MSLARVHNFSISIDGLATGEGLTFEAPFGHAGERLHEWMFTTRYWHAMQGEPGGSWGVDDAFARLHSDGFGAEIMGRGKFGPQTGPWAEIGTDDEWRGWWGPNSLGQISRRRQKSGDTAENRGISRQDGPFSIRVGPVRSRSIHTECGQSVGKLWAPRGADPGGSRALGPGRFA